MTLDRELAPFVLLFFAVDYVALLMLTWSGADWAGVVNVGHPIVLLHVSGWVGRLELFEPRDLPHMAALGYAAYCVVRHAFIYVGAVIGVVATLQLLLAACIFAVASVIRAGGDRAYYWASMLLFISAHAILHLQFVATVVVCIRYVNSMSPSRSMN